MHNAGLRLRNSVPAFDIVGLNEYIDNTNVLVEDFDTTILGCDGGHLKESLYDRDSIHYGKYPNTSSHRRYHYPIGEFYEWDCWYLACYPAPELDGNVGISTHASYPIVAFHEHEWLTEIDYSRRRVHGFIFAHVQLCSSPALFVAVYVAHIYAHSDGCDRACRRAALVQMRDKMKEYSGATPWPVIVMGDFNIGDPQT